MPRDRRAGGRNGWHLTPRDCWAITLGGYGQSVRITQRDPRGTFYRIVTDARGRRTWRSLGTSSRAEARRLGELLLQELHGAAEHAVPRERDGESERRPQGGGQLTIGELWERYRNSPEFRRNASTTQADKLSRGPLLVLGLGADTPVHQLTGHDATRYIELRERGTGWPDGRVTHRPRGARTVQADLTLLRTMLNWACGVRGADGQRLLETNPLKDLKLPRERNPRRPVATHTRFEHTLDAIRRLHDAETDIDERRRWRRLEVALRLAEACGRRVGSVRCLDWSDIDWRTGSIHWRAEWDKEERDARIPIPTAVHGVLRQYWIEAGRPTHGLVLPSPRGRECSTSMLSADLRAAEQAAGLEPLDGGLWHPYRRKWVTERKDAPLKDLMAAGGWSDVGTIMTCYLHVDDETLSRIVNSPAKLVEDEDGRHTLRRIGEPQGKRGPSPDPSDEG